MPDWLPFGCHAWQKVDYQYWKPIIESYGYDLPEPFGINAIGSRKQIAIEYLFMRSPRANVNRKRSMKNRMHSMLPCNRALAVWGWGTFGKKGFNVSVSAGFDLSIIFDKKHEEGMWYRGAQFAAPNYKMIRDKNVFVIISTTKYEDEIAAELSAHGFAEGEDYIRGTTLMLEVAKTYIKPSINTR